MWKYSQSNKFFFNFDLDNKKFWYTDLNNVYVEKNITSSTIKTRFKELNPRIDYEEDLVKNMLKEMPAACGVQKEDRNLILNLKYAVDSDTFAFCWKLGYTEDEIKEVLIHPLLLALNSLNSQNEELVNIISKKDTEIEQYQIEGAVLKRRLVATKKFNNNEFNSKYVHVNVDELLKYAEKNIESLEESSKNMIKKIECNSTENENSHSLGSTSPDKKFGKSRRKRALETRRQQNLAKIKNLRQDLYEDAETDS